MPSIRTCRNTSFFRAILGGLAVLICPVPAFASPSDLCIEAARDAAERTGVPYHVLLAITLIETGQRRDGDVRPWPWATNSSGDSRWFDTLAEAEAHVQGLLDQGLTNVDLGCFQLNYRWHARNFASVSDMLDPGLNADYAARFLRDLQTRTGDWGSAAAAYHSSTPEYAQRYRMKFDTAYAALDGGEVLLAEAETDERTNGFPLLIAGRNGQFGSLVPSTAGAVPLFGAP